MRAHASHNLMTRNLLKWRRPFSSSLKDGWLRLDVSGAYDPSSGTAACGGIFRDYFHRFVFGFSVNLGECLSIDEDEILGIYHAMKYDIWGIYHGMKIARIYDIWGIYRDILRQHSLPISLELASRQHDFGIIRVESGKEAIEFVLDGCPTSTSTCTSTSLQHYFPLCHELKALTSATNHLHFSYTPHNAASDSFAKFGLSMKLKDASIFLLVPPFAKPFIEKYR